jgi:hypothetical protein
MPQLTPDAQGGDALETFRGYLREYGRDPEQFGIDCGIRMETGAIDAAAAKVEAWRELGATHVSVSTMGQGLTGPDAHIKRLEEFRTAVPA